MIRYWPAPSVVTVRVFSISTGLDASTVTPGSTAPDVSLTTPAIDPWAEAAAGTSTRDAKTAAANLRMVRVLLGNINHRGHGGTGRPAQQAGLPDRIGSMHKHLTGDSCLCIDPTPDPRVASRRPSTVSSVPPCLCGKKIFLRVPSCPEFLLGAS